MLELRYVYHDYFPFHKAFQFSIGLMWLKYCMAQRALKTIFIYRYCILFFSLRVLQRSENSITLGFEKNKIVLTAEPFRIDFLTDDEPVISVNAQGLLKFEHYRMKKAEK